MCGPSMYRQRGLSLIELMISITVGLILMTGVVQLFISSKTTFSTQQALSRIQETGRLGIDFLAEDIRMAGYMGCATRGATNIVNGLESTTDYLVQFNQGIRGYTSADNPLTETVRDNTDVLVVRRASSTAMPIIQDTNNGGQNNANIDVNGTMIDNKCSTELCDGDIAIISDCAQGRIFRATNVTSIGNSGFEIRMEHAKSGDPANKDTKLGGQQFGAGAEVFKMNTLAYYVADSAVTGQPGLWQRVNSERYELLEGVEDMSLQYGIAGTFYDTASVPNWDAVDTVRVELLVRSTEDNVVPEPQDIVFAGETVEPNDRRMRQVFSSTVAIRNRLQ